MEENWLEWAKDPFGEDNGIIPTVWPDRMPVGYALTVQHDRHAGRGVPDCPWPDGGAQREEHCRMIVVSVPFGFVQYVGVPNGDGAFAVDFLEVSELKTLLSHANTTVVNVSDMRAGKSLLGDDWDGSVWCL